MSQSGSVSGGTVTGFIRRIDGNSGSCLPSGGGVVNLIGATGLTVTSAGNTSTISVSGNTEPWTVTGVSGPTNRNEGYISTAAITLTLPAIATDGDFVDFIVDAAAALTIQANAGQKIRLGANISTAAGTATSTAHGDAISLVYRQATLTWLTWNEIGNWLLA